MNNGVDSENTSQKSPQKKRRVPLPQTKIRFTCCDTCATIAWESLKNIGLKAHMTCAHTIVVRADEETTIKALKADGWNLNTELDKACFEVVRK